MIDEISMVSSDLWTETDVRLSEIVSTSNELLYTCLSVVVIVDYLQLPPVKRKFIFSRFNRKSKMNQILSLQL